MPAGQSYDDVVAALSYGAAHELTVRLRCDDGTDLTAVPVAVDPGRGALEVVLRLPSTDEIVVPLARIRTVEFA